MYVIHNTTDGKISKQKLIKVSQYGAKNMFNLHRVLVFHTGVCLTNANRLLLPEICVAFHS